MVQSAFKAIESGCPYCAFRESISQVNDSIAEIVASDIISIVNVKLMTSGSCVL